MIEKLDTIKKSLREEKDSCVAEVKTLKAQLAVAEETVLKVVGALNALEERPARAGTRKSGSSTPNKPSPTKQATLSVILKILSENPSVPLEDLEGLVSDKLTEQGRDLKGFAMRFKEALGDPRILEREPGVYAISQGIGPKN